MHTKICWEVLEGTQLQDSNGPIDWFGELKLSRRWLSPCNLIHRCQRFGGRYCLHRQGQSVSPVSKQTNSKRQAEWPCFFVYLMGLLFDLEGNTSFSNVGKFLPHDTASIPDHSNIRMTIGLCLSSSFRMVRLWTMNSKDVKINSQGIVWRVVQAISSKDWEHSQNMSDDSRFLGRDSNSRRPGYKAQY